ncbi:hypothetical protein [Streptomyces sp. NPDC014734]|uniref:hypothetical protein n=1 Tax=Streptomyces sp. NPDC014734 TaxID=3364886 RepID=UPI003700DD38
MILTRGARVTGAVLCALLAVVVACWLIRDLGAADDQEQLWRYWAGFYDARLHVMPATTGGDLVLLVVYLVAAGAALRSSVAATAMVATGVVTIAVRLPGLWTIGASGMNGRFSDDLRTRALLCAFVALAAGITLIAAAGAGRRPPADFSEQVPSRTGQGAGVTAFLLLGVGGAVVAAWEIRQLVRLPELFPDWYVGGALGTQGLIDPPPGWSSALVVLLCLFAGVSALAGAVHARPFGLIAAAMLLPAGVTGVIRATHYDMLEHFGELPVENQLLVLSWFLESAVAVVVLLVLARRGTAVAPDHPHQGYGPGYGYPGPGPSGPPPPNRPPSFGPPPDQPPPSFGPPPDQPPPSFGPPPPNQPPPPAQPPPGW